MALANYRTQTRFLLANPSASTNLYSDTAVDLAINIARGQLAGEGECVRYNGTLTLTSGSRSFAFSSISTGVSATTGIQGVLNVRQITATLGSGGTYVHPRSYEWLNLYYLSQPIPNNGRPNLFAQYAQGAGGSIFLEPIPDDAYALTLDCVCYPIDLVDDTTVEAIPFPWTDCIPFYACYYLYNSAQRAADADRYYKQYQVYMQRARSMSNPTVVENVYEQQPDQTMTNKLGIQARG